MSSFENIIKEEIKNILLEVKEPKEPPKAKPLPKGKDMSPEKEEKKEEPKEENPKPKQGTDQGTKRARARRDAEKVSGKEKKVVEPKKFDDMSDDEKNIASKSYYSKLARELGGGKLAKDKTHEERVETGKKVKDKALDAYYKKPGDRTEEEKLLAHLIKKPEEPKQEEIPKEELPKEEPKKETPAEKDERERQKKLQIAKDKAELERQKRAEIAQEKAAERAAIAKEKEASLQTKEQSKAERAKEAEQEKIRSLDAKEQERLAKEKEEQERKQSEYKNSEVRKDYEKALETARQVGIEDPNEAASKISERLGYFFLNFDQPNERMVAAKVKPQSISKIEKVADTSETKDKTLRYAKMLYEKDTTGGIDDDDIKNRVGFYVDDKGDIIDRRGNVMKTTQPEIEEPVNQIDDTEVIGKGQEKVKQDVLSHLNMLEEMENALGLVDLPNELVDEIKKLKKYKTGDYLHKMLNLPTTMEINPLSMLTDPVGFLSSITKELRQQAFRNAQKEYGVNDQELKEIIDRSRLNVKDDLHLLNREPEDYLKKHKEKLKKKHPKDADKEVVQDIEKKVKMGQLKEGL